MGFFSSEFAGLETRTTMEASKARATRCFASQGGGISHKKAQKTKNFGSLVPLCGYSTLYKEGNPS